MALDAVRERRVDERVGVVRAAAVDVQGLHDAPRVLDDREREDLRRQRLVHARDVEGKFAIQNIEGPGVLRVLCRERPVLVLRAIHDLFAEVRGYGHVLAVAVDLGLPARQAPVVAEPLDHAVHEDAAGVAEVREGHRRVVPEGLATPLVALNKSRLV